jgi:hypothetical protein
LTVKDLFGSLGICGSHEGKTTKPRIQGGVVLSQNWTLPDKIRSGRYFGEDFEKAFFFIIINFDFLKKFLASIDFQEIVRKYNQGSRI